MKICFPFLFKLFFAHETLIFDSNFKFKCGAEPTNPDFLINFSYIPLEFFRVSWDILGYDADKSLAHDF